MSSTPSPSANGRVYVSRRKAAPLAATPPSEVNASVDSESDALAKQYQKKSDRDHVLDAPDMYIGSIESVNADMWVFDNESDRIVLRTIEYIPGLYKLYDESVVNCRDHVVRMLQSSAPNKKCVSFIDTTIGEDGTITLENDGNGIDIVKHPEYDLWIPEMVFGHLRTSTNYDKSEKKIVGGKNGFGMKLCFIWSTRGSVETVDHIRGLKYTQEFRNNLSEICPPVITKVAKSVKPYTKVSFTPDYARLGVAGLSADMLALMTKRVYDIGALTDLGTKKLRVGLNGALTPAKNFQQYVDLYLGPKAEAPRVYETTGERWEYVVAMSPTQQFEQVSFANGICTFKGGKHVDYIMGQICRKIAALIEKKKKLVLSKNSVKVIREHMIVFLRCDVENPSFDSQTKDFLNTPSSAFGSACEVSDAFVEKLAKIGVMDAVCAISELREAKTARKSDGKKTGSVRGIQNFMDANFAGGAKSKECVLILCEGLSAMSGVVSGLSSSDRNTVGIYPLRGKLLNVRGEQTAALTKNREITELKKIMALETGKEYGPEEVAKSLRYGKIMILTDSDVDGSHIKALCINLFHVEWPSLFRIPGFLSFMNTPILTARRAGKLLQFYNEGEYLTWKAETPSAGWTIKYFKGLGTSTAAEFKQYFADKKVVDFRYDYGDEPSRGWINVEECARLEPPNRDDDSIDKVFNKKRADERKLWLEAYDKTAYLNTSAPSVSYANFVNKELIHFSVYDCARSIPNMVDGLKVSQRKILFAAFKRKMTGEVKVAQFSGYVSEHACYHHGEVSLQGAIVNMAQTFVGSNNINLLEPRGQFGSRLQGGKDSASSRYIFTQLNPLARLLFPHVDDAVLTYTDDDGTLVEPEFYVPILPFVLINGISGIGTGFSTSIPPYNPREIVRYLKSYLKCASFGANGCITGENMESTQTLAPFYEGFKGTISRLEKHKFLVRGAHSILSDGATVHITELPIDTWTSIYLEKVMEPLMDAGVDKSGAKVEPQIRNFVSNSTDKTVDIMVSFETGKAAELAADVDATGVSALEKLLKLTSTVSTSNIHLFDKHGKLRRYSGPEAIVDDFIEVRMAAYGLRKKSLLAEYARRAHKMSNRARYIQLVLDGVVDLRKKSNAAIDEMLEAVGLARIEDSYDYLVQMPMRSVSRESVDKLLHEKAEIEGEMAALDAAPLSRLWLADLGEFEARYAEYTEARNAEQISDVSAKKKTPIKRAVKN